MSHRTVSKSSQRWKSRRHAAERQACGGLSVEKLEGRALLATLSFVEGGVGSGTLTNPVAGYVGTQDVVLFSRLPDSNFGGDTGVSVDQQDADDAGVAGVRQGLLKFDNLFTSTGETGKIPLGSVINSASLSVAVNNDSNGSMQISLYRMRQNWSQSAATWNTPTLGNTNPVGGVQASENESFDLPPDAILLDGSTPTIPTRRTFDVTLSLKHWASGEANYGWLFESNATNGWDFITSEAAAGDRPALIVDFTAPTSSAQGTVEFLDRAPRVTEGDAGTRTISVPVARFGGLAATTVGVAVTASSASAADFSYTGGSTLTFAQGEGVKNIDIVVKGDTLIEGLETLAVTLTPTAGSAVTAGRGVATLTIADDDLLINEVLANAQGAGPSNRRYVEFIGTPGATIPDGWQFVVFEGEEEERGGKDASGAAVNAEGAGIGVADVVVNLSGLTIGSNGLLVVANSGWLYTADTGTTVAPTPLPALENSSQTYALWYSPAGSFVAGEDYDRDRYLVQSTTAGFQVEEGPGVGVLDTALLPAGAQLVDSVGTVEGGGNDRDRVVGLANPGVHVHIPTGKGAGGVTPDAISRRFGQRDPNTIGVWFNGEVSNPTASPVAYDTAPHANVVNPLGSVITPGAPNILRTVFFSATSLEVPEAGGPAVLTVSRSGDTSDIDVAYSFTDQTASSVGNADYTATPGVLQFRNGATTATITVPINANDGRAEGFETFLVNLTTVSAVGGAQNRYLAVGGSATVTIVDANVAVSNFRQGLGGYSGTADTYLDGTLKDLAFGQGEEMVVDLQKGEGEVSLAGLATRPQQALLRFDNVFGSGAGQVPAGSEIFGGFLTLNVLNQSTSTANITLHRMLVDWNENTSTFATPQGSAGSVAANGIMPDGVVAVSRPDTRMTSPGKAGRVQIPLNLATLQAWANGSVPNHGWAILSDSPNSFRFESSESSLPTAFAPQLTVLYNAPTGAGRAAFALDEGTRVNEGATASIVVNRVGGSTGTLQVDYSIIPGSGSLADLGSASPTSPLTFADGELSKVIQVPTVNDTTVEPDESFSIRLSSGGVTVGTTSLTIRDNDFNPATSALMLNEIYINSPGLDPSHEFIELSGTAGLGMGGFYVLVIDSDLGPETGLDDVTFGLGDFRNGTTGFSLITSEDTDPAANRGDVSGPGNFGFRIPSGTTRITSAALNSEAIANDSASYVLVYSPTADLPTMGYDFDWNNDGVLDLPAGASIVDSAAVNDGGIGDVLYGGTNFYQSAFVADSIGRLQGVTTANSTAAWFGGDLKGSDDAGVYEGAPKNYALPVEGAAITPGEANVAASSARVGLVSVAAAGDGQSLVLTFNGPISQVLDGDGSFQGAAGTGISVSDAAGNAVTNVQSQPNVTGLGTNTLTVTFRGNAVSQGVPPVGNYKLNFVGNSLIGNGRSVDADRDSATTTASNGVVEFQVASSGSGRTLSVPTDTVLTVASGSQTVSTAYAGSTRLVKRGAGTVVLSGTSSHTGGMVVEEGEVVVRNVAALGTGLLDVRAGAKVTLDTGISRIPVGSLALAATGRIDLGRAGLVVAAGGYNLASVRQAIIAGRNGGAWTGTSGITSAAAAAASTTRTVGYGVDGSGLLRIAFAAHGDTNLDSVVDLVDLLQILGSGVYGTTTAASWSEGDSNYDGISDLLDLLAILGSNAYDQGDYNPAPPTSNSLPVGPMTAGSPAESPTSAGSVTEGATTATAAMVEESAAPAGDSSGQMQGMFAAISVELQRSSSPAVKKKAFASL